MKKVLAIFAGIALALLPATAQQIQSQWAGKRVAFLGDSITDANQLKGPNNIYWRQMQDILGIEPLVYGINGHQMRQIPGQADKLLADHGQAVDAILVFAGTNDYNSGIPLGEWYSYDTVSADYNGKFIETPHRSLIFSEETFRGRINITLRHLKTNFPDKQIILLTPIHRGYAEFGPTNHQPDESHSNRIGIFVDEYIKVIKEAANVWSVPVIDLNALCGLYPNMDEHTGYFRKAKTDRLHPNTAGQMRMAWTLACQLTAFPASFPKFVALTFDDGPTTDITPRILDLIAKYDIPATFFVNGNKIDKKSVKVMQRAHDMGCEIENHTITHPHLTTLKPEEVKAEIEKNSEIIEKYTSEAPHYLRPPYLDWNAEVAAATGLTLIGGYCPSDWEPTQTVQGRIDGILTNIKDGDVLLMHDFEGNEGTVKALETVIPELLSRGFTFVTVSELFKLRFPDGQEPRHDIVYHNVYSQE